MPGMLKFVVLFYLPVVNTAAFLLFWIDKRRSQRKHYRIPERNLLITAFLGGSFGALVGQKTLHHKTQKEPFRSRLILIAALHISLIALIALLAPREFFYIS
jgi:uncharacterized membrane protein YsdA (DUF1294 family)